MAKKNQLLKFEQLYNQYNAEMEYSQNQWDWENKRSMGPTLSEYRIFRRPRSTWAIIVEYLKKKAKSGNVHARNLILAISEMEKPGKENAFLDAYDDYIYAINE